MFASVKSLAAMAVAGAVGVASFSPTDHELLRQPTHPSLIDANLPPILTRQELLGVSEDPFAWRLSGGGDSLASLKDGPDGHMLSVERFSAGASTQIPLAFDAADMGWGVGANRLYLAVDQDGNENYALHTVDLTEETPKIVPVLKEPAGSAQLEQYVPGNDHLVYVSHNRRDPGLLDLYLVDVSSGTEELVAENPGQVLEWHVGRSNGVFARTRRLENGSISIDIPGDDGWRDLVEVAIDESLEFIGNRVIDQSVLALSNRGRDKTALVRFSLIDGSETVVHADPDADIEWVWRTANSNLPIVAQTYRGRGQQHYFDAAIEKDIEALKVTAQASDAIVAIQDIDADGKTLVVALFDKTGRPQTWLLDRAQNQHRLLHDNQRDRTANPLAITEPVSFTARDGLEIHGYVTRPVGVGDERLPAIVWVHGGPFARSYWGFDPMVQLLANRGYVVIDVNFRGSSGYGRAFTAAARGEFSRKMHTDLIDAVDWADAQGLIDPERVAIGGASYGGWASLVGLAEASDRFVAGISINGASDLRSLVSWLSPMPNIWTDFAGNPADRASVADMQARSPLHNAENVVDPLLVVHAINDRRVPVNHSQRLVTRLRSLDRPVEALWVPGQGHALSNEAQFIVVAEQIELFLAEHLGGRVSVN